MAPQGFFWWPGIETFLHGSFSFTHGASPSLATLYIAPQLSWPDMTGDLTVNYLPGGDSYTFTDCILDFISVERGPDGRQVWGLHILDRRWKWVDCGRISGHYNVRTARGDGDTDVFGPSLMPLKDLLALCLTALGEDYYGFNLGQVDEVAYPEVDWDYERPAQALLALCDQFSYRVILTLENQVLVAKANQGNYLPEFQYLSGATTLNPPNTPSALVAAAGHTLAQYDFALVPMALELDGSIVALNEVSYAPDTELRWGGIDLPDFLGIEDPVAREYAKRSVFKYYMIGAPCTMEGIDPQNPENDEIEDIVRVLPLLDVQITKAPPGFQPVDEDSEDAVPTPSQPLPAWVYGLWATYDDPRGMATEGDEIDSAVPTGKYPYEFQINGERGLVVFADYTYRQPSLGTDSSDVSAGDGGYLAATLYLRTSCNVRDAESYGWLRAETVQALPNANLSTPPKYLKSDDVALKVTYSFTGFGEVDGSSDNSQQVKEQANYLLAAALAKMTIEDPQSYEYPGFVFPDLDGAIQQVTWNVGEDGKASTQCNRNKEDLVNTPSYAEQRQQSLLQMALANAEKTGRVKNQNAAQNLTISGL